MYDGGKKGKNEGAMGLERRYCREFALRTASLCNDDKAEKGHGS